jgi:hypothetical protein
VSHAASQRAYAETMPSGATRGTSPDPSDSAAGSKPTASATPAGQDRGLGETRAERYRRRFEDHRLGSVVLLVVAATAGIGAAIGGVQQTVALFEGSPETAVESSPGVARTSSSAPDVHLRSSELGTAVNARYGFSFSYPLRWKRNDPVNGDGLQAVGPEPGLEVLGYGGLPIPPAASKTASGDPFAWAEAQAAHYVEGTDSEIVESPRQQNVKQVLGERSSTEVFGARMVVSVPGEAGFPDVTQVVLLTTADGRDVTMVCSTPTELYDQYEGACNQLISSLTLLPLWPAEP